MSLLKALGKEERQNMSGDDLLNEIIKQIGVADGPIMIRTVYESRDQTKDLWLEITPLMIDKMRSEQIASEIQTDGVVH